MRRVLFLDFDGVLNDDAWFQSDQRSLLWGARNIDASDEPAYRLELAKADLRPEYVAKVLALIRELDLELWVCSAWRNLFSDAQLKQILAHHDLPVHGATRRRKMSEYHDIRVDAILDAVRDFPADTCWCVLDDQVDPTLVQGRGVCPLDGATDEDVAKVRQIFLDWIVPPEPKVHLVDWAAQGDLRIRCTQLWTKSAWRWTPEDALPEGVYMAEPYRGSKDFIRYTFGRDKTTCLDCRGKP